MEILNHFEFYTFKKIIALFYGIICSSADIWLYYLSNKYHLFQTEADDIYDLSNLLGLPVEVIRSTLLEDMMQFYGKHEHKKLNFYLVKVLSILKQET